MASQRCCSNVDPPAMSATTTSFVAGPETMSTIARLDADAGIDAVHPSVPLARVQTLTPPPLLLLLLDDDEAAAVLLLLDDDAAALVLLVVPVLAATDALLLDAPPGAARAACALDEEVTVAPPAPLAPPAPPAPLVLLLVAPMLDDAGVPALDEALAVPPPIPPLVDETLPELEDDETLVSPVCDPQLAAPSVTSPTSAMHEDRPAREQSARKWKAMIRTAYPPSNGPSIAESCPEFQRKGARSQRRKEDFLSLCAFAPLRLCAFAPLR